MLRRAGLAFSFCMGCTLDTVGNGTVVEDPRLVDGFTSIRVSDAIGATVEADPSVSVAIVSDSNLVDFVVAQVDAGELRLSMENGMTVEATELSAKVGLPVFDKLTLDGSGAVDAMEVQASTFVLTSSGSGPATLGGTCVTLEIEASGSSTIDASALACDNVHVTLSGQGIVTVFAALAVDGSVDGDATLNVQGAPSLQDVRVYGNGSVVYE